MPEYELTESVEAAPDAVFGYVSEIGNLTEYIPHMVEAEPQKDGLHVVADVDGRREEGKAWFRADAGERRMTWGGGAHHYQGELRVSPSGGGSSVSIRITTDMDGDEAEIRRSLDEALRNIRAHGAG